VPRPSWWALPARNTLDRATAMLPRLFRARMDEIGLDFSVVYSTMGLRLPAHDDAEMRQAGTRALNTMMADLFREQADRMTPVASIPMHTPEEAVAELDHVVKTLGFKAIMVASNVRRAVPEVARRAPEMARYASWIDPIAFGSLYDYDPVWRKCAELKLAVTAHSPSSGWGARATTTNYIYNHVGSFAAAGEAFCKALVIGGVTRRFPQLNFGFLEGGTAWACELYTGLVGHCGKRNRHDIRNLDPSVADLGLLRQLFAEYGPDIVARTGHDVNDLGSAQMGGVQREDPSMIDELALCGVEKAEDLRALFEPCFYFGCEADDKLAALAFDSEKLPFGARLKAMFSSDIGHWDVPDLREVLEEAHELVEDGAMSEADFREFTFVNPAMLHARVNPDFFKGTVVEDAVAKLIAYQ
jgi:predicted TIM-barrel fold metal-dependent hydrolase